MAQPMPLNRSHLYRRVSLYAVLVVTLSSGFGQSRDSVRAKADHVVVIKHQHVLRLIRREEVLSEYKVALGGNPVGPKMQQGDHKTPEGKYILDSRNSKSQFYKSLHISYPKTEQTLAARKRGVSPGGNVFVHGLPNGYRTIGQLIGSEIGRMAVSPLPTRKWMRYGREFQRGRQLRSGPRS